MSSVKLSDLKKTVLITGGTGLVGRELSKLLSEEGHQVAHLSRNEKGDIYPTYHWDIEKKEMDDEAIKSAHYIIHLAGAGVANKRWDKKRKKEIYDSRINSTRFLREKVKALNPSLEYFLSASAIGYYGWDSGFKLVDESSPKGKGFLSWVVEDWEKEATAFDEIGIKNGRLRIGLVLSSKGGALAEMVRPIQLGMGAALGSGRQYLSWIHLADLCGIFSFMLAHKLTETINGVAPRPETNNSFTRKLAAQLKKPVWLPNVPHFMLKLLVGEMSDMLIGGNNVSSKRIEEKGYNFKHPTLEDALLDLYH